MTNTVELIGAQMEVIQYHGDLLLAGMFCMIGLLLWIGVRTGGLFAWALVFCLAGASVSEAGGIYTNGADKTKWWFDWVGSVNLAGQSGRFTYQGDGSQQGEYIYRSAITNYAGRILLKRGSDGSWHGDIGTGSYEPDSANAATGPLRTGPGVSAIPGTFYNQGWNRLQFTVSTAVAAMDCYEVRGLPGQTQVCEGDTWDSRYHFQFFTDAAGNSWVQATLKASAQMPDNWDGVTPFSDSDYVLTPTVLKPAISNAVAPGTGGTFSNVTIIVNSNGTSTAAVESYLAQIRDEIRRTGNAGALQANIQGTLLQSQTRTIGSDIVTAVDSHRVMVYSNWVQQMRQQVVQQASLDALNASVSNAAAQAHQDASGTGAAVSVSISVTSGPVYVSVTSGPVYVSSTVGVVQVNTTGVEVRLDDLLANITNEHAYLPELGDMSWTSAVPVVASEGTISNILAASGEIGSNVLSRQMSFGAALRQAFTFHVPELGQQAVWSIPFHFGGEEHILTIDMGAHAGAIGLVRALLVLAIGFRGVLVIFRMIQEVAII